MGMPGFGTVAVPVWCVTAHLVCSSATASVTAHEIVVTRSHGMGRALFVGLCCVSSSGHSEICAGVYTPAGVCCPGVCGSLRGSVRTRGQRM